MSEERVMRKCGVCLGDKGFLSSIYNFNSSKKIKKD